MSVSPSSCRFSCTLLLSALIFVFSAVPCIAAAPNAKVPVTSVKKKLLLYAKNPVTWAIVKRGGSGTMIYSELTGVFTLNASGLHPRAEYALIRYADVPPRAEILVRGISDERGRLDMAGVWRNWTRKFWLVSGEDVAGKAGEAGSLRAWRPGRYLFEEKPLGLDRISLNPKERK